MKSHSALILLLFSGLLGSCGGRQSDLPQPEATLSDSKAAQHDFRALARRWMAAGPGPARAKLERPLQAFLQRYPDDPRSALVRIYLAWIRIQQGKLEDAQKLVAPIREGPAGSAKDFAKVTDAAILIRRGNPGEALSLLTPLDGKIVDADQRMVYGEQLVLAAIGAKRWRSTLAYMLDWLLQAPPEDREAVQTDIDHLLDQVPTRALEGSLVDLDREAKQVGAEASRSPARNWLRKTLRDRLTRLALEKRDAALAKRLLERGPSALRVGQRGEKLTELAASGDVRPRVAGRSVGLVLGLGSADARRRSAAVALGMARALGLPERGREPGAVRLLTRDDGGSDDGTAHALAELAGDGAVILVAGVDDAGATAAARYAESAKIPLIVLRRSKGLSPGSHSFVLGAEPGVDEHLIVDALHSRGATSSALVGPGGVPCDSQPPSAGMPRFPVQRWHRDHIDGLALLGDVTCAGDAIRELAHIGDRPKLGFGLECAQMIADTGRKQPAVAVSAGSFPYRAGAAPDAMKQWVAHYGAPPGWYDVLGHDAAVLAAAALSGFPMERVDDPATVQKLHRRALGELSRASANLWSSDQHGFSASHLLERKFKVVAAPGPVPGKKR